MARLGAVTVYLHPICSFFGRNTSSPSFFWSSQQNTVRIWEVGRGSQECNSVKQHWPNTYEASIQSPALQNNNNKRKQTNKKLVLTLKIYIYFCLFFFFWCPYSLCFYVCAQSCIDQKLLLGVFLYCFLSLLRHGLSLGLELTDWLRRLQRKLERSSFLRLLLVFGLQKLTTTLCSSAHTGNSKAYLHARISHHFFH